MLKTSSKTLIIYLILLITYRAAIPQAKPVMQMQAPSQAIQCVDLLGIEDMDEPQRNKKVVQEQNIVPAINPEPSSKEEKKLMPAKEESKVVPAKEEKKVIPVVAQQVAKESPPKPQSAVDLLADELSKAQMAILIDMTEITLGKLIGVGASAEVFKGMYRGTEVAVKKLRQFAQADSAVIMKELKRELYTLSLMRHPNLVLFMGSGISPEGNFCIVTEYCGGGTIFKLLHENIHVALSWKQRIKMALDVAKGMNCLHSHKPPIIHRDLKSLNLLLAEPVKGATDYVHTKITDFGLARFQSQDQLMTGSAGTFVI